LDHKRALAYACLFLERSYERDLLWNVVRSSQRKVMELKLGADINEIVFKDNTYFPVFVKAMLT